MALSTRFGTIFFYNGQKFAKRQQPPRGGSPETLRPCRAVGGADADRAARRDPAAGDARRRQEPAPAKAGGYDSADFVMALRDQAVTPHVAQHTNGRRSAIDESTAGHPGYAISQRI